MTDPSGVAAYIAAAPASRRADLELTRSTVVSAAPMAIESIAYQMPALRLDGQFLVSYAAFKAHYSLFPASAAVVEALGDAIAPYLAGKGTIRFPADKPLPLDVIRRVVEVRLVEHGTR